MWRGVYIMKGYIKMQFKDNYMAKVDVALEHVGFTDKCVAVDTLLDALDAKGLERLSILAAVVGAVTSKDKEGNKNESRRFRNQNI